MAWWNPLTWGQQSQSSPMQQGNRRQDFYGALEQLKRQMESNPQTAKSQGEVISRFTNLYGPSSGIYGGAQGEAISPQEIEASVQNLYGSGTTGQVTPYAGSGGGGSYDRTRDPNLVAQKRNQVMGLRGGLDSLFNQIYSGINTQAAQQQAESQQAFKTSQDALTNNFMRNDNQNAAAYTSRNAYDSSFRANAQDQIKSDFNTQSQQNQQGYDKRLADIGNYVATARAGVEGSRPQWDAYGQYNDTNSLESAYNQLMGLEGNLRQQLAGLGSNDAYRQLAQSVTPYAQQQSQGVVDQLQKLAGTAGDPNAKNIAAGTYIAQLPDQNTKDYWTKFFEAQQKGA